MKLNIWKRIEDVARVSKKTIVKYAPQLMAVAGAGCFIGATYCAIKETPEATRRLEEKQKLDENMSALEKVAVGGPAYKKTACLTVAGLVFTAGAWKIESDKMAEMVGIAATAISHSRVVDDVTKEVVGEEKAKEIKDKVNASRDDICPFDEADPNLIIPGEYAKVPCMFALTGQTFTNSRKGIVDGMESSIMYLKNSGEICIEEVVGNIGGGQLDLELFWTVDRTNGFGYDEDATREMLGYSIEPWEDKYHRLGWLIQMDNYPHGLN